MDRRKAVSWATIISLPVAILLILTFSQSNDWFFHKSLHRYLYWHRQSDTSRPVDKLPDEIDGSGVMHENMLDNAFDLATGQIASDVANKMREAKPEKVEVRIIRGVDQAMTQLLKDGLSGQMKVDEIQVAPFMIVHLDAAEKSAFEITPLTQDRQLVSGEGYTTWAWTVKPLEAGKHSLYLTVGSRFKLSNHDEETQFKRLYERHIDVEVDEMYEAKLFLSGNWQWLMGSLIIPLAGFVWHHWKRKPKTTTLFP
jgi:hypothetical protein